MFVDEAARRGVNDAVDQPLRQRTIVALVDGDVAMVFVGDDMLIEVAGERSALATAAKYAALSAAALVEMFNMMCSLSVLNDRSGAPGVRGRVKDRAATAKRRWGSRFSSAATGSARIFAARDPPKKMVGPRRP